MSEWDAASGGDSDDPWGEEPDWAVSDDEHDNGNGNGNGNGNDPSDSNGRSSRTTDATSSTIAALPGAQHILILLDCHHSMFQPYIRNRKEEHNDDDRTDANADANANASNDVTTTMAMTMLSPIDAALIAAQRLLHHRAHHVATTRTGKRDGVGIVLFNCPLNAGNANGNDAVGECSSTGVRRLVELAPPGVDQIQTVRSYMTPNANENANANGIPPMGRMRDLEKELYGHLAKNEQGQQNQNSAEAESEDQIISLRSALFQINRILADAKCVKTVSSRDIEDSKTVWIFTNQDDPAHGDGEQREVMQSVCKDLEENDVGVKLWALPKVEGEGVGAGGLFDRGKFYDYITTVDEEDADEEHDGDGDNDGGEANRHDLNLDQLLEQFCITWEKTRKMQSIPMYLPDWNLYNTHDEHGDTMDVPMEDQINSNAHHENSEQERAYPGIMLDIYQIIRIKKKPQPTTIHSGTRKKTNKTTDILATETGEIIPPERIHRFIEFGGERVSISKQELSRIKKDSNAHPKKASLILLGFKPMSSIPRIHQYPLIDRSLFAYPNDDLVKGSRVAFATLHAAMLRKNVLGIGELLQRINATSRMVAIVPQEEELSEDGMIQEVPPGFLLIPLAYEDDIRAIPETPETGDYEADSELVSAAEGFMTKLRLENVVIGESFENPALKVFWNYMESVALGTLLVENDPDEDDTTWDVDAILSVCGGEIETFKQLLPEDEVIVKERKRKVTTVRADETNIDWFHEYEENTFEDLTVEELKAYCRSQGEKVGGRKVDLIQRVKDHIRSRIDDLPSKHTNQTLENV